MRSLTRAEVRDVDRSAIECYGLPGLVLMENAGAGTARLLGSLDSPGPVVIACGKGNNGGDGFVIARHLEIAGWAVRILLACRPDEIRGDAAVNLAVAERSGLTIECLAEADQAAWERGLAGADWIVDALLGTGASGPPTGATAAAVAAINAVRARGGVRVLAVDLPSGLDCDSGCSLGECVRADVTATFVARKRGFEAVGSEAFTGAVHVIGIGAPRLADTSQEPSTAARSMPRCRQSRVGPETSVMNELLPNTLRSLLFGRSTAALATLHDGRPSASMIPFATLVSPEGLLLVTHVSGLATHTREMRSSPEVSLLVTDPETSDSTPQSLPRVSLAARAEFIPLDHPDYSLLKAGYLEKFPQATNLFQLGDFSIVVFRPESARLVAGFARAVTLPADVLAAVLSGSAQA